MPEAASPTVFAVPAPEGQDFDKKRMRIGMGMRVGFLLERTGLSRLMGMTFDGQRDMYGSFGWARSINVQMLHDMYNRGGIAKRIAHAYADSTWGRPPRIFLPSTEQPQDPATAGDSQSSSSVPALPAPPAPSRQLPTANAAAVAPAVPTAEGTVSLEDARKWTQDFAKLAWDLDLWDRLKRADVLSNLGRYSIVLIGTNRGRLEDPLPTGGAGGLKITYLQPYSENRLRIKTWDQNPKSSRFGMPLLYTITPVTALRNARQTLEEGDNAPQGSAFDVHFSRVIHITQGTLESDVYGNPIYGACWNYLEDLTKVIGASSESFWKNSYPGLHMNVDKDMDLDDEDEANLTAEMDEFQHDLRRYLRTRGVDVNAIGSKIADPRGAVGVLVDLIAGTTGIPKRILMGSESGQLASSQDKASWAERIEEYRELHAEPRILWPFVMWVINNGLLPLPAGADVRTLRALWPDAYRMSPLERGQTAAQTARSLANIAKGIEPITLEEGVDEIPATPEKTDPITGKVTPANPGRAGKDPVKAPPLISREEARRIIGLSTDQAVLTEFPEDF